MNQATNLKQWKNLTKAEQSRFNFDNYTNDGQCSLDGRTDWFQHDLPTGPMKEPSHQLTKTHFKKSSGHQASSKERRQSRIQLIWLRIHNIASIVTNRCWNFQGQESTYQVPHLLSHSEPGILLWILFLLGFTDASSGFRHSPPVKKSIQDYGRS